MRLIHTVTHQLECFDDERQRPGYAILSHTWGDQEVTLQQFKDAYDPTKHVPDLSNNAGYVKIISACAQARRDKLEYLWVDTCCIDKTSSAELSEAINSMFRWYEQAQICYVYLGDLCLPSEQDQASHVFQEENKVDTYWFGQARWFSRGWTLQELLAPYEVRFFLHDWTYVGKKQSMCQTLSEITGIDKLVLRGGTGLDSVSAAIKMSWASRRVTTRIEDLAYSLLGIFDVNMALLYGEGHRAFERLQEEILRNSDDHSLLFWTEPELPFLSAYGRSPAFAGNPAYFFGIPDIVVLEPPGEHSTVTNKGVKLEVPVLNLSRLHPFNTTTFVVVLSCLFRRSSTFQPGIVVRRLQADRNSHTYVRVNFAPIKVKTADVQARHLRQIYLRQNVTRIWERARYHDTTGFREADQWDPSFIDEQLQSILNSLPRQW